MLARSTEATEGGLLLLNRNLMDGVSRAPKLPITTALFRATGRVPRCFSVGTPRGSCAPSRERARFTSELRARFASGCMNTTTTNKALSQAQGEKQFLSE